jgi:HAD superfamily hydrolase (TIGR01509 family)
MPRQSRAILFDWDGTLVDSYPAGFEASRAVARHFGIPFDRQRFLATYSPNWYESYRAVGLPEENWTRADAIWLETYSQQGIELYPFARATLSTLAGHGYLLGLVTSGNRERVVRELARFQLEDAFCVLVCHEDSSQKKPHPEPLQTALELIGRPPGETVYVGDRPEDILMGLAVGTYTVGVESSYGTRADLERVAPNLLLPHAGHLPGHFGPLAA